MNVPNLITLLRLIMTVACFLCIELVPTDGAGGTFWIWTAFGLFLAAAMSDFVDGYLARRLGQVTKLGRVADPFADKILICGTLILLLRFPGATAIMSDWFVVVIVAREFLVTTIRGLAESSGVPFAAERLGKYKMIAQCVFASALITVVAGASLFRGVAVVSLWVTLVLTIWSGFGYTWKARRLLSSTRA